MAPRASHSVPLRLLLALLTCALALAALSSAAYASGLPPDLNPGVDRTVDEDSTVTFTGSASDPEGDSVALSWEFPGGVFIDGAEVDYVFAEPGDYDVRLWGNDSSNNVSDGVAVTVRDITPPAAVITGGAAQDAIEDESVTMEGTSSSDNVEVVGWLWDVEDTDGTHTLSGDTVSYTWATPGSFVVTLSAVDAAGNVGTMDATFTVADVTNPAAAFTVTTPCNEDSPCTLDASVSTDNVAVVQWTWEIEDAEATFAAYTETVDFTWAQPGTYRVTLTVADAAGNTAATATTVTVFDVTPPVASFELASPFGNVEQTLDGSDSSDNVGVVSWEWSIEDYGASATRTGQMAAYTWLTPGTFDLMLTVTDAAGLTDSALVTVVVTDTTPPVAFAGEDQDIAEDLTHTFDATGTTDNDPLFPLGATFLWEFTDWTSQALTGQTAIYTFEAPGVYSVTLSVTDSAGNWATDALTLTVLDVTPPVATFTLPSMMGNEPQPLDGTNSYDNVGIASWFWAIQDHLGTTTSTESTLTFTWPVAGTYLAALTVGDAAGNFASYSTYALVVDTTAPVASAGPDIAVYQGVEVGFDAQATTDNDPEFPTGAAFEWTFDEGGSQVLSGVAPVYTFSIPGVYLVTLSATDAAGNVGTDTLEVAVREHVPPAADFTLPTTVGNEEQTLDGTLSTDNVGVVSWTWTVEDAGGDVSLQGAVVTYTWMTPGLYNVTLTVSDAADNVNSLTHAVTVTDTTPPTLVLGPAATDEDALFTFDATGTEDNDPAFPVGATFVWTFADGSAKELTGLQPTYTFANPGNFVVTLVATDAAGNAATGQFTLTVRDVTAPVARATMAAAWDEDLAFLLDGSLSSDYVGIVEHRWFVEDTAGTTELTGAYANYTWATPGRFHVTLLVRDGAGNTGQYAALIEVRDVTAPVSSIELVVLVDEDTLQTLSGASSTDNVGVATYEWTVADVGGNHQHFGASATHTWATPGAYDVTLRVLDAAGNAHASTVTVTVRDITAPSIGASVPASWAEDSLVTFDAAATGDNDPAFPVGAAFTWTFFDVTSFVLSGARVSHVFAQPGMYTVSLAVADGAGNMATRQFGLEVLDVTAPVAALVGPTVFDEDTLQTFAATGSLDNVGIDEFEWQFADVGGTEVLSGAQVEYTWATPGTYPVTLTVRDAAGNADLIFRQVTVRDVTAPTAAFELAAAVDEDTLVTFDDVGSSDNVAIAQWQWQLEGAGAPVVLAGDLSTYAFQTPGLYTVILTVTDAAGNSATASKPLAVHDVTAPAAAGAVPFAWPEDIMVTFTALSTTDNDPAFPARASYVWTFDDGGPVELVGPVVSYTFARPGVYAVLLTVTDAAGNSASRGFDIEVSDTTAPWLTVEAPDDHALVNTSTVEVSGSVEPGATLQVGGVEVAVLQGAFHASVPLREGANVIELVASDLAGNRFSVHWVVERDTIAPVLAATQPPDGILTRLAHLTLVGSVTDTHLAMLRVNGGAIAVQPSGAFHLNLDLAEGKNTFVIQATDLAGNVRQQDIVVWRDSTAPQVAVAFQGATGDGDRLTTSNMVVTLSGSVESGTQVQVCSGLTAATLQCAAVNVGSDGRWSAAVNLAPDKETTIEVRLTDAAGNDAAHQYVVVQAVAATPADITWMWVAGAAVAAAAALSGGLMWTRWRRGAL